MDEIDIEERVKILVEELGIDYNGLKPKIKKHLMNIESSISNRESMYIKLKNDLKDNKVTLTSVAEDSGISSRQTLYNNAELKLYIESRMQQANELNPYYQIEGLKAKISDLNEQLHKMAIRDIDTEILRYEVNELKKTIKNREDSISRMEEQAKEMRLRMYNLQKNESLKEVSSDKKSQKGKVISLDDGK